MVQRAGRFYAHAQHRGVNHHLGTFWTREEAKAAYDSFWTETLAAVGKVAPKPPSEFEESTKAESHVEKIQFASDPRGGLYPNVEPAAG